MTIIKVKRKKKLAPPREETKLLNMKATMILIVIGALRTVHKGLEKGLEELEIGGRIDTIQTTSLLKSARILLKK